VLHQPVRSPLASKPGLSLKAHNPLRSLHSSLNKLHCEGEGRIHDEDFGFWVVPSPVNKVPEGEQVVHRSHDSFKVALKYEIELADIPLNVGPNVIYGRDNSPGPSAGFDPLSAGELDERALQQGIDNFSRGWEEFTLLYRILFLFCIHAILQLMSPFMSGFQDELVKTGGVGSAAKYLKRLKKSKALRKAIVRSAALGGGTGALTAALGGDNPLSGAALGAMAGGVTGGTFPAWFGKRNMLAADEGILRAALRRRR
jgi:hypothetical protein